MAFALARSHYSMFEIIKGARRPRTGFVLGFLLLGILILTAAMPGSVSADRPLTTKERYDTMPFPEGSMVIPMDEKQNDTILAFGMMHALLRNDTPCHRLIGPLDPFIVTEEFTSGANYSGGPVVITGFNTSVIEQVRATFPSVTVHNVSRVFVSTRVYRIQEPTKVLLVYKEAHFMQHSFSKILLNSLDIPYDIVQIYHLDWQIQHTDTNPLFDHDLIIFENPGTNGKIGEYPVLVQNIKAAAASGRNFVFIGKALKDVPIIFFDSISTLAPPTVSVYQANFTHTCESPAQYHGPVVLNVTNSEIVAITPGYEDLKVMLHAKHPTLNAEILFASYFRYGKGTVEMFSFDPEDQAGDMYRLACIFYGNRFVQAPPEPLQPPPPLAAGSVPLPAGTVPAPPPPPPPPPPSVPMATTIPAQYLFAGFAGIALGDRLKSKTRPKIAIRHKLKVRA
jgi:hypothetical protein